MYRRFLSLRYLRSRPTNWIGMAGIFVAVTALILILSIMSGFLAESRDHLRGSLSDLIVQPALDRPMRSGPLAGQKPLRDAAGVLEVVRRDPRVEGASAQYVWYAMLAPSDAERVMADPIHGDLALVKMVGIDVEDELSVSSLGEDLQRGPSPTQRSFADLVDKRVADWRDPFAIPPDLELDGRPHDRIVVGAQLADVWKLYPGDTITLVTAVLDPDSGRPVESTPGDFLVAGTFRTENNEFDLETIYLERDALRDWIGREREFTNVTVRLQDYEGQHEAVKQDLGQALFEAGYLHDPARPGFPEIRTWEDFQSTMLAAIENEKALLGIMLMLVLLVAAFTVFAILSMMVTEKRRDIGILTALGASPRGILSMFLMIGFWEALIGAVFGTLGGILGALYINEIEQSLSRLLGITIFNREVYLFDYIPTVIEAAGVASIVGFAFVFSLLAAAIPAWRAARLDPVDALRHE